MQMQKPTSTRAMVKPKTPQCFTIPGCWTRDAYDTLQQDVRGDGDDDDDDINKTENDIK